MYPHERSLVTRFAEKDFAIVGVNSDDSLEALQAAMKENDLTWPSFFDGGGTSGPVAVRWGVTGWPTIYVLDRQGVIRHRDLRGEPLEKAIEELVGEAPPETADAGD